MTDQDHVQTTVTPEIAAAIRQESISQVAKWTVATILILVGFAVSGWLFYLKEKIDNYIIDKAGAIPPDAIVAFDSPGECPKGWTAFNDAAGRVVLGVGRGEGLTPRAYRDRGNAEGVRLTADNIPYHQLDTVIGVIEQATWHNGPVKRAVFGTQMNMAETGLTSPYGKNPPDSISIMPPFIALQICKRGR
ncbi:hypothetical protein [Xanthobacter versatilis]|uniref:hypothetical protein n=1 Tax=Xanthobacter autotrophicus (strain ATCC BAA-1158 / Py2) TaxID=78245 RepID=UPI0037281F0F